jgi:hypothetical protein
MNDDNEGSSKKHDLLRPGGLMRCCTETVADLYRDGQDTPSEFHAIEGSVLQCKYAPENPSHGMRFRNGAWEWDHQELQP